MAYSDGLPGLDKLSDALSNPALNELIGQAGASPTSDDIYLLDVSASMGQPLGSRRRVDVVVDALQAALEQMVFRSAKGSRIAPRYRIAMYAYSDHVYDLLDGIKTVDQVAGLGAPELEPGVLLGASLPGSAQPRCEPSGKVGMT